MTEVHRNKLLQNRVKLVEELEVEVVATFLTQRSE